MKRSRWNALCQSFGRCITALSDEFGITLDYSKQSLAALQTWICEYQPLGALAYPGCVILHGWYLGECVVRAIPGAHWNWRSAGDDPYDWEVTVEALSLRPLVRMCKFYDDREYNLESWWIAAEVGAKGVVDATTFASDIEQALIEAGHVNVEVTAGAREEGRSEAEADRASREAASATNTAQLDFSRCSL